MKQFQSVIFDDQNKQLEILIGTQGKVNYDTIKKASVLYEEAKFRGKSAPFSHQILGGTTMFVIAPDPQLYVGIKLALKDGSIKAIYISDIKTTTNTEIYRKDTKEAKEIQSMILERMNAGQS